MACVQKLNGTCLSKVEIPDEYKMVQFGAASARNVNGNMFNMSMVPDVEDTITKRYTMSDKWDHHETLKYRHVTMRYYKGTIGDVMICGIYNTFGLPNDGLGQMRISVEIKSIGGNELQWVACDDRTECEGSPASTLKATHKLIFTHSDGWCVKPVDEEDGISVKFSGIEGFEGITFQLSDGVDESYYFDSEASQALGMSGDVDGNGLVRAGEMPEIIFNLNGILVPQ